MTDTKTDKDKKEEEITEEEIASVESLTLSGYLDRLLFLFKGDYGTALTYFQKAIKINPNYADAYFCIGGCLLYKSLSLYRSSKKLISKLYD